MWGCQKVNLVRKNQILAKQNIFLTACNKKLHMQIEHLQIELKHALKVAHMYKTMIEQIPKAEAVPAGAAGESGAGESGAGASEDELLGWKKAMGRTDKTSNNKQLAIRNLKKAEDKVKMAKEETERAREKVEELKKAQKVKPSAPLWPKLLGKVKNIQNRATDAQETVKNEQETVLGELQERKEKTRERLKKKLKKRKNQTKQTPKPDMSNLRI